MQGVSAGREPWDLPAAPVSIKRIVLKYMRRAAKASAAQKTPGMPERDRRRAAGTSPASEASDLFPAKQSRTRLHYRRRSSRVYALCALNQCIFLSMKLTKSALHFVLERLSIISSVTSITLPELIALRSMYIT